MNVNVFIEELNEFAGIAEATLKEIEGDLTGKRHLFSVFSEKMFTIKGTADQLTLPHVSHVARLGEEIALKAAQTESRGAIRRCVGALWDAVTTVKYLLMHAAEDSEEQQILIHRLEETLRVLGGPRETVGEDEIAALLSARRLKKN